VIKRICLAACFLSGCVSDVSRWQGERDSYALEELRAEVADLKHALHSYQVDLEIVEERLKSQESSLAAIKGSKQPRWEQMSLQLAALEQKLAHVEKLQENAFCDLRELAAHAASTTHSLTQYRDKIAECEQALDGHARRLEDVSRLKSTLTSLSHAIQQQPSQRLYTVKAGDSLEKIARAHHTTVGVLKQINHLQHDRIVPGQELKLSHE
jgi:LysM repeat protein